MHHKEQERTKIVNIKTIKMCPPKELVHKTINKLFEKKEPQTLCTHKELLLLGARVHRQKAYNR